MKTVLVTGAGGFIGSHLCEALVIKGYKVRAMVRYNSKNNWGWLENSKCKDRIEVVLGDIRNYDSVKGALKGVDSVFHLAALIGIPYSYTTPESYVDTNIKGTLNLLHAAKEFKIKKFIQTSTSEVYGTAQYVPIDEAHLLQPKSPYSASKIGADAVAMSFYNVFNLPLVIARPFNTYGPRQSARAIIPNIITQIASGKKGIEMGDLSPVRDFTYVKDTCAAFIALAECAKAEGEIVNIGSNQGISIAELFVLIKEIMNSRARLVVKKERIRPKKSEVFRLLCDNSKLKELIGFTPRHSLKTGLVETVKWFNNPKNLANYKTKLYNV